MSIPRQALAATILLLALPATALPAGFNPGSFILERVYTNLSFRQALAMAELPDGSGRFVVAERAGVLRIFDGDEATPTADVWMDISPRVATARDFALNGFAFDPDFATTGHVYLHYNWNSGLGEEDPDYGSARISRFTAQPPGFATLDPDSEFIVYSHRKPMLDGVAKPLQDHNGGNIAFGPDGMLYIAFGDGGSDPRVPTSDMSGQDPLGHGQSTADPFGCIFRIDVKGTPDPGINYRIPTDNPFHAGGGPDGTATRKEIYAYGFRNPWRIAFDPYNGRLYAADVGAKAREEVNVVHPGLNYGWSDTEGELCFPPGSTGCNPDSHELPIVTIDWQGLTGERHSISGGFVYAGTATPTLQGAYLYSDYLTGGVWALRSEDGITDVAELVAPSTSLPANPANIWVGFGQDLEGEVYLLDFKTAGGIYVLRYDPSAPTPTPTATPIPTQTPAPTPAQDAFHVL